MSDLTNDADSIDEKYNYLLKEPRETGAEVLRLMRLISQTLPDCRDRMEDRSEFRDIVMRIDALGVYRLN